MKDLHPIQIKILKKLLFAENVNYGRLKPIEMESSQFAFHLDKLIEIGLVQKNSKGIYSLTLEGKNTTNRIDFDSKIPNKQAKVSVVMCCTRNSSKEILIYRRLKNPFYGCYGFPTGKVQYGELIEDAAKRELLEETNLEGNPLLIGIRHYRVFPKGEETLLEDKVMYIFKFDNPIGDLKGNTEGEFKWVDINEEIINPLEEFDEILNLLKTFSGQITFKEFNHYTNKF